MPNKREPLFKKCRAFTLVEVLVALTVIGIIVILTLPTLQEQVQEMAMKVKRKALYSRTAQAMAITSPLNTFESAYDFIAHEYKEIYNIDRICGDEQFPVQACNLPQIIYRADGSEIEMPYRWSQLNEDLIDLNYEDDTGIYEYSQNDSESVSFITDNGESINLFLNPECKLFNQSTLDSFYSGRLACINMIYDTNGGSLPPNQIGKDIGFITVFGPQKPVVVAPFISAENLESAPYDNTKDICKTQGFNYTLPTRFQLASMYINGKLFGLSDDGAVGFWSANAGNNNTVYAIHAKSGYIEERETGASLSVRCVTK